MKNKYFLVSFCFVLLFSAALSAQTEDSTIILGQGTSTDAHLRLQLALSSAVYQVTPGDVFTLAYATGTTRVSYQVLVDNACRIRVANLGIVDATGKTLTQIKNQVEAIVSNNYPMSGVQFVLTQPAAFTVFLAGEVNAAMSVPTWALDRVSSVLQGRLTSFASLRNITVKSANGQVKVCDLFQAGRFGDLNHDPYLRPGDVITINRFERSITINGAVERPGKYQLLQGENLKELIEIYGSGFTPVADKTRLELVRLVNGHEVSGDKIFLKENDLAENYTLEDYDVITVPAITRLQPVIFVEGAVGVTTGATATASTVTPTVSTRMTVPFNQGENYASLIRRNPGWFSAVSDTLNAYIIRGEEHIPMNLNPMLYDASYRSDVVIKENDILMIPFRQYFVTVAGAVKVPGRYPYIPDRDWSYYIALAGGFIPGMNAYEAVKIVDINGKKMGKQSVITPETIITASTNDFLFYFNQYAPVITTLLSVTTAGLSLYMTYRTLAK